MASLGQNFDATTIEPNAPRDILPPGKYLAQIIKSEMKDSKSGGQYLSLEFEVMDGPHARAHLWDILNLVNANAIAQDIAHRTLSSICHATGQMQVSDSEQLHFKPMVVDVKVKPSEGQYGPKNQIGGYEAGGGSRATASAHPAQKPAYQAPAQQRAAPPAAAAATPPWRRNAAA